MYRNNSRIVCNSTNVSGPPDSRPLLGAVHTARTVYVSLRGRAAIAFKRVDSVLGYSETDMLQRVGRSVRARTIHLLREPAADLAQIRGREDKPNSPAVKPFGRALTV